MRVLIVENELYLAQSISNRLSDLGYVCDIISAVEQVKTEFDYDVLLLSTNVNHFDELVEHFKQSVIILLVSYISVDTVTDPLKAGACDYIQKPFMVEELIRKIKHHQHYKALDFLNKSYLAYIQSNLSKAKLSNFNYKKLKLPLILKTHKQINADAFVFNYAKAHQLIFSCVDLANLSSNERILKDLAKNSLLFLMNFQSLKSDEKEKLLAQLDKKQVIIHTSSDLENPPFVVFDINDTEKDLHNNEILTIDEYVRYIIVTYQNMLPDTDLSKKLGISRKSLWEKRKKYGLTKKK